MKRLAPRKEYQLDSVFNDFVNHTFHSVLNNKQMMVDIKDEGDKYLLEAELPGVKKDDVEVELYDDRLTISAENSKSIEEKDDNYIRRERGFSSMTRSFHIPDIREEEVTAEFKDGVLSIDLPKKDTTSKSINKIDVK
ncbi:Hsp20/alpha crystallin family protein [Dethiothermospora halolimnae]|uniref:Hsp20/alpha crystallin family protein n=1 Tax=Dethiothermospora halolimnae TaxID=3114390 RepID=UPI003CCC26EB